MTDVPPPPPPDPAPHLYSGESPDASNLKTLSTCWYVFAALVLLPSCFGLGYIALGTFFGGVGVLAGASAKDGGAAVVGSFLGVIPCCIGGGITAATVTISFLSFRCARNLAARRNISLCTITGIIACLFFPLGTVLGVFTLVVLNRPTVKAMFPPR